MKPEYSELLMRLALFKKSYDSLKKTMSAFDEDELNQIISDTYPFDKSFDELNIDAWVSSASHKITNM